MHDGPDVDKAHEKYKAVDGLDSKAGNDLNGFISDLLPIHCRS